ncbi:MAG: FAD-dependent oxidoreductase, partial [Cytophagaceae bacterium]
ENLQKTNAAELDDLDVKVFSGLGVASIDRAGRTVTDQEGQVFPYDKLILATGSRANIPADVPAEKKGIFTMRQREDAERLMRFLTPSSKAVIVGGGLLGLELADALTELNTEVSIVQRSSRLMDRQLDVLASELLNEELQDRGIKVYFNDEILSISGVEAVSGIKLKSGKFISCDILIYAIGTVPNTELSKSSGLKCNRGVCVNDYLQTSDPDIFAVGEIAEHNGSLYGITAAAEEQAEILAEYLNGNEASYYSGSLSMNILKVKGLNLCSLGIVEYPEEDKDYESVTIIDKASRYYKKCIIYKDKLVGAILLGDKSEFKEYKELIGGKLELADKRKKLLRGGEGSAKVVEGKLVCSCNNVGEGNIKKVLQKGCTELKMVCLETGAGTGCGSCRPEVKKLIEQFEEVVGGTEILEKL